MKRSSANWHAARANTYRAKHKRTCTYRNCKRPHLAHGLCRKHYERMRAGKISLDAMGNVVVTHKIEVIYSLYHATYPCRVCGAPKYYTRCINSLCGMERFE